MLEPARIVELYCEKHGLPAPLREVYFARPVRDWQFDLAWVDQRIALEIEGGVWTGGGHTSSVGFMEDIDKYNEATLRGWRLLRCTPSQIDSGKALGWLERILR